MNFDLVLLIIFSCIFTGLGLLLKSGRGANLIAGYNFLPDSEKKKYNEEALTNTTGNLMLVTVGFMIIMSLGEEYFPPILSGLLVLGFIMLVIGYCIYVNTHPKFKQKE